MPPLLGFGIHGRDALTYVIPLKQHTARAMVGGSVPLWNGANGFGEPWMANPQTGVLYPPTYLFLLPGIEAFHLYALFHIFILGMGLYLLLREMGASPVPALSGALAVSLSGPILSALDLTFALSSLAWLTPALYWVRRREAAPLGICLVLSFLAGEPMIFGVVSIVAVAAWLFGGRDPVKILPAILLIALALAPQIWLTTGLFLRSGRLTGLADRIGFHHSVFPAEMAEMVLGQAWGAATREPTLMAHQSLLVSVYLCILAGISLICIDRRRWWIPAGMIFCLSAAMGDHSITGPLFVPLFHLFRYPAKFLLFLPVLTALSLASWVGRPGSIGPRRAWFALAVIALPAALAPHPGRAAVHIAAAAVSILILHRGRRFLALIPAIIVLDLLLSFGHFIRPVPSDLLQRAELLPPLAGDASYAFFGDLEALNPAFFQREGNYTFLTDLRWISVGSGYSNLYTGARMAGTAAPMQTTSYRKSKQVLPGVRRLVTIDPARRVRQFTDVTNPQPLAWGEGVSVSSIAVRESGIDLTCEASKDCQLHVGVSADPNWIVYGDIPTETTGEDLDGFTTVPIPAGRGHFSLCYRPKHLLSTAVAGALGLLLLLVWYGTSVWRRST